MTIDLRSDTVTRPTPAMREAIARAEVGDDVYGEDPSVAALEARVAALTGKARALFVSSGTMANQLALLAHCRRGDDVFVSEGAHCAWYESGAAAALAGVQCVTVGQGALFSPEALVAAVKPTAYYTPRARLVALENTHNRGGGRVLDQAQVEAVAETARGLGLALHLDGARLFNAAVASGARVATLAAPFDTVSVCLSKGLGAPVGSLLCGPEALITEAHRYRKMLGGGMRQSGLLAAAGSFALEHHVARLAVDHAHARELAAGLGALAGLTVETPETNIVMVDLPAPTASQVVERAKEQGVLISAFGPARLRLVTHLDVDAAGVAQALGVLRAVLGARP